MRSLPDACVDLIYLDPPFQSDRNYNAMYRAMTGLPVDEQVEAFCDTWAMTPEKEETARHLPVLMRQHGVHEEYAEFWAPWANSLRHTQPKLFAYIIYMVERLLEMRRILKPTGSLYFHCDPTVGHYIKCALDGIFTHRNFRNEIVWCYKSRPQSKKYFGRKHDTIFFYTKSDTYTFNWQDVVRPLTEATQKKYRHVDEDGRRFRLQGRGLKDSPVRSAKDVPLEWEQTHPELVVRDYLDEKIGVAREDWWTDIGILNQSAKMRLGYPTQKHPDLLKRIILASSNPGDVVLDPFCGCGTTIYAAHELGREWWGCDIAILATRLIRDSLQRWYGLEDKRDYKVTGIPVTVEQGRELARADPFQFQHWFVERVGGFPSLKKTADRGIDGRIYFETRGDAAAKTHLREVILSVKGGATGPGDVRDLRGVVEREARAEMGALLTLQAPTAAMRAEAASAGMYTDPADGAAYPRLQVLSLAEVLEEEKSLKTPAKVRTKADTGQGSLL